MEKLIKKFLTGNGDGNGYGYGDGNGNGNGNGNGDGNGYGNGDGYGNGNGNGDGNGDGYGNGDGNGYGNGDGYGNGNGDGYGNGNGNGKILLKTYKKQLVYYVDGIPCVFKSINKNLLFAKVAIINQSDLSSSLQFIYKFNNCFAHGNSLKEAKRDAENKYYSQLDVSERISAFHEAFKDGIKYDAELFFTWHTTLTGSCDSGKKHWVKERGIDLKSKITVEEFINLTKDSYGGEVIKQLKSRN